MAAPAVTPKIYTGLVLDFETGGLDATRCACTQVAVQAVRFDTWETIDRYASYIYPYSRQQIGTTRRKVLHTRAQITGQTEPLMDYEQVALDYSGISLEQLYAVGAPLEQVAADILRVAAAATLSKGPQCKPILIGQNIPFDIAFLQQMMAYAAQGKEFEKVVAGTKDFYGNFQPHYIDTLDLARMALAHDPQVTSYKLELVCERLGIELDDAHDAEADVTATVQVARVCSARLRNAAEGGISQAREKTRDHFKI